MYDSKQSNSIIHACHKWSCFFFFFFFFWVFLFNFFVFFCLLLDFVGLFTFKFLG